MPIRCLLVDDNDTFLQAASILLQREGLTVVGVASNSAEALRQARTLRPDVILVDIGLGDESGFDLARLLAQDGQGGGAEVILISARRNRLCGADRRKPGGRILGEVGAVGAGD